MYATISRSDDDLTVSFGWIAPQSDLDGQKPSGFPGYTSADRTLFETEITNGAAAWNASTSRTVFKEVLKQPPGNQVLSEVPDVTIKGYWYEHSGHCGTPPPGFHVVLGCTFSGTGHYPHIGQQPLWLKFPPAGFAITGVPTAWTSNLSLAKSDPSFYYLPQIVKHELGHSAGLGHLFVGTLTMSEYALVSSLQGRDVDAMLEVTNPH